MGKTLVHDEATLAAVDRWLEYRVWHSRVPGAQVAVGVAGEVLLSRAYGHADLERRVPMRTDHLFRIASHSKTFTATLVLQLVDQGQVGLDDPIGRRLTDLADIPLGDVRVRELLEHTGGVLRDGLDSDYWQFDRPFPDREQLLALVRDGGPKAEPGERFAYSNLGYSLLGLLVEAVTGDTFAAAAQQRIVTPLGLQHTAADYLADRSHDYAVGYTGLHTEVTHRRLEHVHTQAMAAATGFTSTATDLVTYFAAHAFGDTRLLSDRTKRLQQRRANDIDPEDDASGAYGWGMGIEDIDGETFVGHGGGYPGHITKTLLDPETGLVVSVLTNAIDGPASALAKGVVQLLRRAGANADGTRTPAAERQREPVDPASVQKLTGRYGGAWGVTDIALLGGRLNTVDPTSWTPLSGADELDPVGDARLRIASGGGTGSVGEYVTFDLADDEVRSLRYGGMTLQPRRELPPLY